MTIQPFLHPDPPKSRSVTVISWLAISSGAYITFSATTAMLMLRPSLGLLAALVGGVLAMIGGAGLNQREEWARRGFIFVQAYGILGALIDTAGRPIRVGAVAGLVVGLAINGWIVSKLHSSAVRAEFEASESE